MEPKFKIGDIVKTVGSKIGIIYTVPIGRQENFLGYYGVVFKDHSADSFKEENLQLICNSLLEKYNEKNTN